MANAFNNFFPRTTKELNICIHQVETEDAVSFLKDLFPVNCPNIQIISVTEAEITNTINLFKIDEVVMT